MRYRGTTKNAVGRMQPLLLALLVGSVYLWAYTSAFNAGFVYEDRYSVQPATAERVDFTVGGPRSLTFLTFRAQAGDSPRAHHVVNLALAAGVALLVGIWLRSSGLSAGAAWIGVALMLWHPMSVEATAYVGGRFELVAAFLMMAALCLTNLALKSGPKALTLPLSIAASLAAGLGKESGLAACLFVPATFALRRAWCRFVIAIALMGGAASWLWLARLQEIAVWTQSWPMQGAGCPAMPCALDAAEWLRWQATAAVRMIGMLPVPFGNSVVFDVEIVPIGLQWLSVGWLGALALTALWMIPRSGHAAAGLGMLLAVVVPRLLVPTPGIAV